MALLKTKIPMIELRKIKLDTLKKEIEIEGKKFRVDKEVNEVISLLITEVNVLSTIYDALFETDKIGKS